MAGSSTSSAAPRCGLGTCARRRRHSGAWGGEDPSRRDEAADGLEMVARAADRAGDTTALRAGDRGPARTWRPSRPVGRYVLALEARGALAPADRLELTPAAAGGGARRRHRRLAAAAVRGDAARRQRLRARVAHLSGRGDALHAPRARGGGGAGQSRTARCCVGQARLEAGRASGRARVARGGDQGGLGVRAAA